MEKWVRRVIAVVICSWAVVVLAVAYGQIFLPLLPEHPSSQKTGIIGGMAAWDGEWFVRIATEGYDYSQTRTSSIVFFPACPLLARGVMLVTGLRADLSLLLVANSFLFGAFLLFDRYMRDRPVGCGHEKVVRYALWAMALFPSTFYFRMAYTESTLLFLMILAMYGMRRNWPLVVIAIIIGAATATRSVGVALLAPFMLHLWHTSRFDGPSSPVGAGTTPQGPAGTVTSDWRRRIHHFAFLSMLLMPLACWGILAFAGYQARAFGEPLAFAKGQVAWHDRPLPHSRCERAMNLITFEPIWAVYTRSSPCYWGTRAPRNDVFLNMNFANPIFFVVTAVLVFVGRWKRWLDGPELALSVLLLAIPYVMQANRMGMTSQARFASVVFPAYIVMGHLLSRLPKVVSGQLLICSALLMGTYAALFSLWYFFF